MNYFRCTVGGSGKGNTVTVTCAEEFAGLTITLAKTGKTYTKTCPSTAPYVVTFYGVEVGTYTVSCTVDGQTYSETIIVQDISCVLNYGFTWRTWVDTASQLDSSDYDTLDEVLADEKALRELFLEHACVDYMASMGASNEDLETIINNDLCAKWINLSDYALDFLHDNEVIADLMDEADKYGYGEWALMPQVPKMTSATPPFGEVLSSGYTSSYYAYYAFDGVTTPTSGATNRWIDSRSTGAYIGFHFTEDVKVRRAYIKCGIGGETTTWKIQYSSTGNSDDWHDASDVITFTDATEQYVDVSIGNAAYWRLYGLTTTANSFGVYELQFYAYAPKGNVPVMTSDTAPYGVASATNYNTSGYNAYKAFDGDDSTYWLPSTNSTTEWYYWLQYAATNPICVKKVRINHNQLDSGVTTQAYIQGSNNGATWENIQLVDITQKDAEYVISNNRFYLYHRVNWKTPTHYGGGSGNVSVATLQFYGRELKVSVPTMTSNTAPFGEAFGEGLNTSYAQPWKAFTGSCVGSARANYPLVLNPGQANIGYLFGKDLKVKFAIVNSMHSAGSGTKTSSFKLQYTTDNGTTWTDIADTETDVSVAASTNFTSSSEKQLSFDVLANGIRMADTSSSGTNAHIGQLQFYGLDYSEKEFEVGTTKKWLYDHGVELGTLAERHGKQGIAPIMEADCIRFESQPTSSDSFSQVYVEKDLTNYNLVRAKVGDIFATGNTQILVANLSWSNVSVYNMAVGDAPNNGSLNISSLNDTYNLIFGVKNNSNAKTSLKEWWLE